MDQHVSPLFCSRSESWSEARGDRIVARGPAGRRRTAPGPARVLGSPPPLGSRLHHARLDGRRRGSGSRHFQLAVRLRACRTDLCRISCVDKRPGLAGLLLLPACCARRPGSTVGPTPSVISPVPPRFWRIFSAPKHRRHSVARGGWAIVFIGSPLSRTVSTARPTPSFTSTAPRGSSKISSASSREMRTCAAIYRPAIMSSPACEWIQAMLVSRSSPTARRSPCARP